MNFGKIEKPDIVNGPLVGSNLNTKFVGFSDYNDCIQKYFSKNTIDTISKKITQLLQGVDHQNRPIIVPDRQIGYVMDSVYQAYRPPTGDIYGRYNIPTGNTTESYVQDMIDQVIEIIYSDVKNNLEVEYNNSKLSKWVTVLGDFNDNMLRSHSDIKIRKRRPNPMEFNMNY